MSVSPTSVSRISSSCYCYSLTAAAAAGAAWVDRVNGYCRGKTTSHLMLSMKRCLYTFIAIVQLSVMTIIEDAID